MNTGAQATDVPHWPLVRVTRLWDMLNQAKDWNELCEWFFNHAGSGRYQMYLPVPEGYFVRCSAHPTFDFGLGASTRYVDRPPLPAIGMPLLEVKFVRLSPRIAEKVARQAASKNMLQQSPIADDCFGGGLSMREGFSDASGSYEDLPTAVELRIKSASLEATNAWDRMEIDPTQVVIGDNVYDHIRPLLKDVPNVAIDADGTQSSSASAAPSHEEYEASTAASTVKDTPSTVASAEPQSDATNTDDPYNLKDRALAVYCLYRAAELCHQHHDYQLGFSDRGDRKKIAVAMLASLAEASPRLLKVFNGGRREYAATLIDPERGPNEGQPPKKYREWPTHAAAMLLEQVDARRQTFVNPTLELVIYAAEKWLALSCSPRGDNKSRVPVLDAWLTEHGLTGAQERKTLFPIITFDGVKFQSAPKSAAPSPYRASASGGRRASRRRV